MSDMDLDELRSELADFAESEKKGGRSPREERIIAGFEEIQRFVEKHGRVPQHGEDRDIFERVNAVRLNRLRTLEECRSLLTPLDHQGLLSGAQIVAAASAETISDDELLAELQEAAAAGGIAELRVGGGEKGRQFGGREGARCRVTLWPAVGAGMERKLTASSLRPDCRQFWPEGCGKSCL